jgi:hypothetical protein
VEICLAGSDALPNEPQYFLEKFGTAEISSFFRLYPLIFKCQYKTFSKNKQAIT